MRIDMKRALLACLLALMIVPAVAGATFPVGDGRPVPVSQENGPRLPAPVPPTASAPRIVREVHNITTHDGSPTLAVVLAALALSIAVAGTGYVTLRVRPLLRS